MGLNDLYGSRKLPVGVSVNWPVFAQRLGRIMRQIIVTAPVDDRPHGPPFEPAAAIGANVFQNIFHAGLAKRAFMAADPRLGRMGRKLLGAVFADWPKLKHHQLHVKPAP
jgi:hypothetical protein